MAELTDKLVHLIDRIENLNDAPNMDGFHSMDYDLNDYSIFDKYENYVTTNNMLKRIYKAIVNHVTSSEDTNKIDVVDNLQMFAKSFDGSYDYLVRASDTVLKQGISSNYSETNLDYNTDLNNFIKTEGFDLDDFLDKNTLTLMNPNISIIETREQIESFIDECEAVLDVSGLHAIANQGFDVRTIRVIQKLLTPEVTGQTNATTDTTTFEDGSVSTIDTTIRSGSTYGELSDGFPSGRYSYQYTDDSFDSNTAISFSDANTFASIAQQNPNQVNPPFVPWYIDRTRIQFWISVVDWTEYEQRINLTTNDSLTTDKRRITRTLNRGAENNGDGFKFLFNGVLSLSKKELSSYPNGLKLKVWLILDEEKGELYEQRKEDISGGWRNDLFTKSERKFILVNEYEVDNSKQNQEIDLYGIYTPDFSQATSSITPDNQTRYIRRVTEGDDYKTIYNYDRYESFVNATYTWGVSFESDYHKVMYHYNKNELTALYPDAIDAT